MSMLKKLILMVFSLLLCINLSPHILAYSGDSQVGSIELAFEDSQTSHISFSLYKIGDVIDGSDVQYVPSKSFSNLTFDLNNITKAEDYEEIINQCLTLIDENNIHYVQKVKGNSSGNVFFDDLQLGLYLIKQDDEIESFQSECLIVSVPLNTGEGLVYDVVAKPKYGKDTETTENPKEPVVHVTTSDDTNIESLVITLLVSGTFVCLLYFFIKHDKTR